MNFRHSAITLFSALVIDGNFQQISAMAQANHCADRIGFGPAPCLDTNIVSNEFTAFMHNECVNGESTTLCDQYNPVWGQVHSSYQNKDDTGCDLSNCEDLLYVHPVFDTFVEESTKHEITSFTHCTEDACSLDDTDAAAAIECWNIFSSCFPNKIDKYHVVVELGTNFDDASKLSEHYIYKSLPFAGSKSKDPKCDACKDCYDKCQQSIGSSDSDSDVFKAFQTSESESNLADISSTNDVSSSNTVVSSLFISSLIVAATGTVIFL